MSTALQFECDLWSYPNHDFLIHVELTTGRCEAHGKLYVIYSFL